MGAAGWAEVTEEIDFVPHIRLLVCAGMAQQGAAALFFV